MKNIKANIFLFAMLAVSPMTSPVKARNYAMASKPVGVRLAWV
jgi:hypothetical protein